MECLIAVRQAIALGAQNVLLTSVLQHVIDVQIFRPSLTNNVRIRLCPFGVINTINGVAGVNER